MSSQKAIYVIVSQTQTRFAKTIRFFGNQTYNHCAISLTPDFDEVYAFARPQHGAIFLGRLVRETRERYTLNRNSNVPVQIIRIGVSDDDYEWITYRVRHMLENPDYMYNLFSVLTYPLFKGFPTYRAFTCVEFVAYLLKHCGHLENIPASKCTPDQLLKEMHTKIVYIGYGQNFLQENQDSDYFEALTIALHIRNLLALGKIFYRTVGRFVPIFNRRLSLYD